MFSSLTIRCFGIIYSSLDFKTDIMGDKRSVIQGIWKALWIYAIARARKTQAESHAYL